METELIVGGRDWESQKDRRLWSESRTQDFRISETGHPQGHFLGSGCGGGTDMKVTAGDKIKEPEDDITHVIIEVTQNNSRIYGKSVVLKLECA